MKKNEQASLQLLKITIITLILMLTFSIAVRAFSNSSLNNVKIKLSNNYEMNIVTTKKKVSDILNENHIVVLPDEIVFPSLDSELEDNNIIKIAKANSEESKVLELANSENIISAEQVLGNYANVIEKIETVDEVIPYETITKDTSSVSSNDRTNKVIQQGKDGLKRTTYKVKYKNDIEISRTVISEEIIEKAVNKIVQVNKSTSRDGEETSRTGSTSIASIAAKSNNLAKQVEGIYCFYMWKETN